MKNKKPLWLILLVVVLGMIALFLMGGNEAMDVADEKQKTATEEKAEEHSEEEGEEHGDSTEISNDAAQSAGIETVIVGPGAIRETVRLSGRVVLNQNRSAEVKARYPGIVRGVFKEIGQKVNRGEKLATVESNESLQVYAVPSPLTGVVLQRQISVGDMAADTPIFTVADLSSVWAEFYVFAADMQDVQQGQPILIRTLDGKATGESVLDTIQPMAEASSQTVVARTQIDNSSGQWRAGMTVQGDAVIRAQEVALAVPTSSLQRMENNDVVFVREGTRYKAVPVKLGLADAIWTEVTEGLQPGVEVVAKNSFIVKADIAKAGAQHED